MKLQLYYSWQQHDWEDEGRIKVNTFDSSEYMNEEILLKVIEIDAPDIVEPSREKIIKHKTEKLEEDKKQLMAETQMKLNQIEDKIRQLQAIEYKN